MIWIDRLDGVLAGCANILRVAASVILITMLLINLLNMVLRLVHMREINQIVPWTEFLFVWMSFLGFFVLHRERRDIVVDYLVRRFALAGQHAARIGSNILIAILLAIALAQAPMIFRLQNGVINMVGLPRYFLSLPFFISAVLILADAIVDTALALSGRRRTVAIEAEIGADG